MMLRMADGTVDELLLTRAEWAEAASTHRKLAQAWTQPTRDRRARGEKHPVHDFLNTYYQVSLGRLESWHPGFGVALEDCSEARALFSERHYRFAEGSCTVDPTLLDKKARERLQFMQRLLEATQLRPPNFACHGLHEWAMVYRGTMIRHRETAPLRLSQGEMDDVVESRPLCCTHFDAFRFFSPDAQPLNRVQPDLWAREENEQPGCIHVNMDLYKWSAKSQPWVSSALLWECFLLALKAREVDMRASPYDLSGYDYPPIAVETEAGRASYEVEQRALEEEARPLRRKLIAALQIVLAAHEGEDHIRRDAGRSPFP